MEKKKGSAGDKKQGSEKATLKRVDSLKRKKGSEPEEWEPFVPSVKSRGGGIVISEPQGEETMTRKKNRGDEKGDVKKMKGKQTVGDVSEGDDELESSAFQRQDKGIGNDIDTEIKFEFTTKGTTKRYEVLFTNKEKYLTEWVDSSMTQKGQRVLGVKIQSNPAEVLALCIGTRCLLLKATRGVKYSSLAKLFLGNKNMVSFQMKESTVNALAGLLGIPKKRLVSMDDCYSVLSRKKLSVNKGNWVKLLATQLKIDPDEVQDHKWDSTMPVSKFLAQVDTEQLLSAVKQAIVASLI